MLYSYKISTVFPLKSTYESGENNQNSETPKAKAQSTQCSGSFFPSRMHQTKYLWKLLMLDTKNLRYSWLIKLLSSLFLFAFRLVNFYWSVFKFAVVCSAFAVSSQCSSSITMLFSSQIRIPACFFSVTCLCGISLFVESRCRARPLAT